MPTFFCWGSTLDARSPATPAFSWLVGRPAPAAEASVGQGKAKKKTEARARRRISAGRASARRVDSTRGCRAARASIKFRIEFLFLFYLKKKGKVARRCGARRRGPPRRRGAAGRQPRRRPPRRPSLRPSRRRRGLAVPSHTPHLPARGAPADPRAQAAEGGARARGRPSPRPGAGGRRRPGKTPRHATPVSRHRFQQKRPLQTQTTAITFPTPYSIITPFISRFRGD